MTAASLPAALVDRMAREIEYFLLQEGATSRLTDFAEHVLGVLEYAGEVREEWQGKGFPWLHDDPDEWYPCGNEDVAREYDTRRHRTTYYTSFSTPWVEVTPEGAKPC